MQNLMMKLLKNEEGQAMTEYGLIIAIVAVVVALALGVLAGNLDDLFRNRITF